MQLNIIKSLKIENNISRALNEFERIIFSINRKKNIDLSSIEMKNYMIMFKS